MIPVVLRDWRWRMALVALAGFLLFLSELSVQREAAVSGGEMGPVGLGAPAAYLAGISMIALLSGFISADRREGYARLLFSHPVRPLALYGLRLALAYALSLAAAALLLLLLQAYLWGELRGGASALLLPALTAFVYGGLMTFFSAALRSGDAVAALLFLLPTFLPPALLEILAGVLGRAPGQVLLLVLPPQTTALTDVYQGLLAGQVPAGAVAFVVGYGAFWLLLGGLVVKLREMP